MLSIAIVYSKNQANNIKEANIPVITVEYVLIIEITWFSVKGLLKRFIENPTHLLKKINLVYIPKLNQPSVFSEYINDSALIIIKAKKASDKIDYNKMLMSIENTLLEEHNKNLSLYKRINFKPTKVSQEPIEIKTKTQSKAKVLIPVICLILGILFGFFADIREFIKKVKEIEKSSSIAG